MRLVEVTSLTLVGGKKVKISFSNGHRGLLDLTDLLGPGFDEAFGMVAIEDGDLVWPSGATLKAERLYLDATPQQGWRERVFGAHDSWDQAAAALGEQGSSSEGPRHQAQRAAEQLHEFAGQVQREAQEIAQAVDKATHWAAEQIPYQIVRQGLRWAATVPYVHQEGTRTIYAQTKTGLRSKVHRQLTKDFWDHPEVLQQMIEDRRPDL